MKIVENDSVSPEDLDDDTVGTGDEERLLVSLSVHKGVDVLPSDMSISKQTDLGHQQDPILLPSRGSSEQSGHVTEGVVLLSGTTKGIGIS